MHGDLRPREWLLAIGALVIGVVVGTAAAVGFHDWGLGRGPSVFAGILVTAGLIALLFSELERRLD